MRIPLVAAILGIVLSAGTFAGPADAGYLCGCLDLELGGRLTVGFSQAPVPMMTSQFEFAVGKPLFSVSAWGEIAGLTSPTVTAGAQASLARDWLSLSVLLEQSAVSAGMSVVAQATPPSWLLIYANPSIAAAVNARITAPVLGSRQPSEISASPSIIAIIPAWDSLLTCSLSANLQLDSSATSITVPSTAIAADYSLGLAVLSGSVRFAGLTSRIASARLTVEIPDWGLEFSANLTPSGFGDLFYSVTASFQWGDTSLLPRKASEAGSSTCPGGICY
jgi:hypothetical protein